MNEADRVRLRHILDAARQALSFVQGRVRGDLDCDPMLQHALVRLLEVIGEAAKGISNEARSAHANVPWREMAGMRDRLIHAYFDVDLDRVWKTVTERLPPLIEQLSVLLGEDRA
jgi:uncharacterized protein with HEPN domain